MTSVVSDSNIRQGVLAVTVLEDIDLVPGDAGITVPGIAEVELSWAQLQQACGDLDPMSPRGRRRLANTLRIVTHAAAHGEQGIAELQAGAIAIALPTDHLEHPGDGWAHDTIPGGLLEIGIAIRGLVDDSERIVPLSPVAAVALGIEADTWWRQVHEHAQRMSQLAIQHLHRDGRNAGVIRPVGGCDVLTLLGSREFRTALAGLDGTGMRSVAIPTRNRGWFTVKAVDPDYVGAVWNITDEADRGLDKVVLVTKDEVTTPRRPPRPTE